MTLPDRRSIEPRLTAAGFIIDFYENSSYFGDAACSSEHLSSAHIVQHFQTTNRNLFTGATYRRAPWKSQWTIYYHPFFGEVFREHHTEARKLLGGLFYGQTVRYLVQTFGCSSPEYRHVENMLMEIWRKVR